MKADEKIERFRNIREYLREYLSATLGEEPPETPPPWLITLCDLAGAKRDPQTGEWSWPE
jgi:hypothetical protein